MFYGLTASIDAFEVSLAELSDCESVSNIDPTSTLSINGLTRLLVSKARADAQNGCRPEGILTAPQ